MNQAVLATCPAAEEPDGTTASLRGAVNKRNGRTQLFTLDQSLALIPPTGSNPIHFLNYSHVCDFYMGQ